MEQAAIAGQCRADLVHGSQTHKDVKLSNGGQLNGVKPHVDELHHTDCSRGVQCVPRKTSCGGKAAGGWPLIFTTGGKHDVPVVFHEPHVESGFRLLGQPWSYYLLSIFQLHNESLNIWTHFLAFALTARKLMAFQFEADLLNDVYAWPLAAGLSCALVLYACSTAAHWFQSRSELAHHVAFTFDYAGIGLYGLGSVVMHLHYCSEPAFYDAVDWFFVPAGCILAVLICLCCSISKVLYQRPYPFVRKIWQIAPVGGIYFLLISPIVHRLLTCYIYDVDCKPSIPYHIEQIVWFATSAFFFTAEFPQSLLSPGRCDHFFHGHQLFHIAIMMSTLRQADAVFIDFKTRRDAILLRAPPTLLSACCPIVSVICIELVCITFFYFYTKQRLSKVK